MKRWQLRALDTFDSDSESFKVGEYDTKEEALKSVQRREKRKNAKAGDTFYEYHIVDPKGNKIYLDEDETDNP